MDKKKTLLVNIIQFGLSTFLPKAIVFFMLPLYTYCLTTAEYGIVDLFNTTVQLVLPFSTLQIQDAIFCFSMDKRYRPADVFTAGIRILCAGTTVIVLVLLVSRWSGLLGADYHYLWFMIIALLTSGFRNISIYFCKGIEKIKCVTAANIGTTIITVVCNLCFLLMFKWGINGFLSAICIGNCFGGVWLFFHAKLYKYITFRFDDKKLIKQIVVFSIPMIFSALSWWANNSIDKYVLQYYTDSASVGILAVAYKIPAILSLFGTAVSGAYSVSAVKEFDKNDKDGFLGHSYHTISSCYVLACAILITLNVFLAKLLFANEFFAAWKYVPPLIYSTLFSLLSLTCEQFFVALRKTHIISVTAVCGAFFNFVLNIVLIPRAGVYGAATATCISFFVVWICRYLILRYYLHLKNEFCNELVSYILLLGMVVFAYHGTRHLILQILIVGFIFVLNGKCILTILHTMSTLRRCKSGDNYDRNHLSNRKE